MKKKVIALMITLAMVFGAMSPAIAISAYAADEADEAESYTFGDERGGELDVKDRTKSYEITLTEKQHVYIYVFSKREVTVSVYNSSGKCVSSEANSVSTARDDGSGYDLTHSCNLDPGTYTIQLEKRLLKTSFSFYAEAEDIISVSVPTITSISSPKAGTAKVVCEPAAGALEYEYQYAESSDFSNAKTETGTASSMEISELTPGASYFFRVRATNRYSDGSAVYSNWSKIQTVTIAKKSNKVTISTKAKTVKRSKLKKNKKQTFKIVAKDKAGATLKYSIKSVPKKAKKYITIGKSSGKVTVKKGIKKGKYKVKVQVKALSTSEYKSASKTKTITITVK